MNQFIRLSGLVAFALLALGACRTYPDYAAGFHFPIESGDTAQGGTKPATVETGVVTSALHREVAVRERKKTSYTIGETVKVISGPLSDFDGEIVDVNADQQKLKVLVDIFERQVPVELGFDQVKKID